MLRIEKQRDFSKVADATAVPDLIDIQLAAYKRFLQQEAEPAKRKNEGLEGLLREVFPITSYDGQATLEYLDYELGEARYTQQECRNLKLTYGLPLRVRCRLSRKDKKDVVEESIYVGEIPIMIGGGEFIVNGTERVIVSQLHRSPGVDFTVEMEESDRPLHGARVIPERGSWVELNVTKKESIAMRIDQSGKIPATMFLRAMDAKYGADASIIREFYPTKSVHVDQLRPQTHVVEPFVDPETGEELVPSGGQIGEALTKIASSKIKSVEVVDKVADPLMLNTLAEDPSDSHENALLRLYMRLRPGNPPQLEKAKTLFAEKFYDENRYRLGKVGRFRINRKFHQNIPIEKNSQPVSQDDVSTWLKANLEFRCVECSQLSDDDISTLEERLILEFPSSMNVMGLTHLPRFSREPKNPGKIKDNWESKASEELRKKLGECINTAALKTGWSTDPNDAPKGKAVYFFRDRKSLRVNDGYVGMAGERKDGSDARGRMNSHYGENFPGDSLRKSLKELIEGERTRSPLTLHSQDFVNTLKYVLGLRAGEGVVDDIDHLGNRRLRTIDELACEELRKGFIKLRRTAQERMSLKEPGELKKISELINSKSISSSIDFFFGRSELSQVVDHQNPLSQLTHERRLSALGAGGLNRKRAGFEVRDVHISHYGRICPIETPEGNNIGLISSLSIYAGVDEYGFLITPYRKVTRGRVTDEVVQLRADEEMEATLAPPDVMARSTRGSERLPGEHVLARVKGDVSTVAGEDVGYVDVSPKQTVGISAALIPFLEHDDANRALMGSNMQRQAVPLLRTEPPIVATGMERVVAENSSTAIRARKAGTVTYVDAQRILIDNADEYELRKFSKLNERVCLNQKPIVREGQRVRKNQIIADGSGTCQGELALGKNAMVAFMPFDGYNFEDAILISERLVKNDSFTSIHLEEYEVEIRETKLGREEFTRDIPNVSERALRNLDENGVVRVGTLVRGGQGYDSILVGKVAPKSKSELTPEEKLLHAIFGRAGEDVKNDSLELPAGEEGIVVEALRFSRRMHMSDEQKKDLTRQMREYREGMNRRLVKVFRTMAEEMNEVLGALMIDPTTRQKIGQSENEAVLLEQIEGFTLAWAKGAKGVVKQQVENIYNRYWPRVVEIQKETKRKLDHMKRGDELPSGVLEMVKVRVATKRKLGVGDKMAGRHGNKGVIAKILPEEDMPFLEDGTSVDLVLNPLGVPSRMNVGQILETHLGWAAAILGFQAVTPVFSGAREAEIRACVREANEHVRARKQDLDAVQQAGITREVLAEMPEEGKVTLYDGRTGLPFEQKITVGCIYMNKLHHLVDEKIHARSTGPYSLITQQPLGGKARTGGQRFGEMEVWALEAYGASYTLQELLTVKSDDVEGRTKIYESMVKGTNTLEAGTPVSFDVLCYELKGLGLNIQLEKKKLI